MNYKTNQEFDAAQDRILELLAEVEDQINDINEITNIIDVDSIIAEQEKAVFIIKLSEIVGNYLRRDVNDQRDNYIEKLERDLELAKSDCDYFKRKYHEAHDNELKLANALEDVAGVLASKA